jgi:predicted MFS family arabinose efflux permease
MAFGIGEATTRTSSSIQPYQGIFVFLGCVSLAFVPLIWFMMPNSPDYRKGHQARRRPTHRD